MADLACRTSRSIPRQHNPSQPGPTDEKLTCSTKQSMLPLWRYGLLRFARNDGWASGTNRLDIVAVGVDQERRVIGRAVIRAWPGAAIVAAAGLQAFGMQLLDRGVILGAERDMRG